MIINRNKAELVIDIYGAQKDLVCQKIVELIDILIDETRIENDTADSNSVLRNQGMIKAFNNLKDYIRQGLPTAQRR